MTKTPSTPHGSSFLSAYFKALIVIVGLAAVLYLPSAAFWIWMSGDVAVERAVQKQASGEFALFGSGVSQDFVDYKLRLWDATRPTVAAVGSSRVMQFRERYFSRSFTNMGGTAGNIPVLRSTIEAMLEKHNPEVMIIGLDFWWFNPKWNADPFKEEPPTSGSYVYNFETLKKPLSWLIEGKISLGEFLWPFGFRNDRFGVMAQQADDGFASDGSWYYASDSRGRKAPFDFQFKETLTQVSSGIKAFSPMPAGFDGPSPAHVDAVCELVRYVESRGIKTFVFIAPLAERVLDAMRVRGGYPHLFALKKALADKGLHVMDFTDPRVLASNECEFVDGFHGGEVTYARILLRLAEANPALRPYVNADAALLTAEAWSGFTLPFDSRLSDLEEVDFMQFSCPKKPDRELLAGANLSDPEDKAVWRKELRNRWADEMHDVFMMQMVRERARAAEEAIQRKLEGKEIPAPQAAKPLPRPEQPAATLSLPAHPCGQRHGCTESSPSQNAETPGTSEQSAQSSAQSQEASPHVPTPVEERVAATAREAVETNVEPASLGKTDNSKAK